MNYSNHYSEQNLWDKIKQFSKTAGEKVVYAVLLLFYLVTDKGVSLKSKATIIGALGYFIFPLDAIPDIMPAIGFTDDLGVLMFALSEVSSSITPEMKKKTKEQLKEWFNKVNESEIKELEENLQS